MGWGIVAFVAGYVLGRIVGAITEVKEVNTDALTQHYNDFK